MSASDASDPRANRRWLWAALIGGAVLLLCIIRFGLDAGSTWDEPSQAQYGDLVIRWFTSGFRDTTATRFENLYLYGGLFEIAAQLLGKMSPLGIFETRHLLIAFVGFGGVVGAGLIAREIAGPRAGVLAGAVLTLTPPWIGHAWFNSKDIPFAAAATIAIWFATRMATRRMPPRMNDVIGSGIATGVALGIRAGGYFLMVYPLCACLLGLAASGSDRRDAQSTRRIVDVTLFRVVMVLPIAWLLMLAAWPWAWSSPIAAPLVAMKFASQFPFSGDTLFRGELFKATAIPFSYLPTWFAITTPEFYVVAFTLGIYAWAVRRQVSMRINRRALVLLIVAIALPIGTALIRKPALYDGLRHFLFIFPLLAALAGVAISAFIAAESVPSMVRAAGLTILLLAAAMTMIDVIELHPYEYAYFNRTFGGLSAAQGRFETDYWGASYKEGLEWVVNDSTASSAPLRVASCNESSNDRLEYYRREWPGVSDRIVIVPPDAHPDLFLESTRRYLCSRVDGRVIHAVSRLGVPLLYVRQTSHRP
jgi:hypothetical protein